jgi:hypothetical protein
MCKIYNLLVVDTILKELKEISMARHLDAGNPLEP